MLLRRLPPTATFIGFRCLEADSRQKRGVTVLHSGPRCFVTEKLKKAGAIIWANATLGELGGGDTHGSLFGSTRNPYALDRTARGSSGGPFESARSQPVGSSGSEHILGIRSCHCRACRFYVRQSPFLDHLYGRPYDGLMIKLAYAYEQATHNRRAPISTPQLPREP